MPYASVDDIKAYLPAPDQNVVTPDNVNIQLIELSVERIIRGYLSGVLTTATMAGWTTPENTPEIIREVAALLIASQLYINQVAASTTNVELRHYGQLLYDRAVLYLQGIVAGTIVIEDVPVVAPSLMSDADFWPVDDTDRAFTMGQQF